MGTKNKPGKFDCYHAADPDEPMFVLLGRDPVASLVVRAWIAVREELAHPEDEEKIEEARTCIRAMAAWAQQLGKGDKVKKAQIAWARVLRDFQNEALIDFANGDVE